MKDALSFLNGYVSHTKKPKIMVNFSNAFPVYLEGFKMCEFCDIPEYVGCLVLAFPIMAQMLVPRGEGNKIHLHWNKQIDKLLMLDFPNNDTEKFIQNLPRIDGMVVRDMILPNDVITSMCLIEWEHRSYNG